MTKENDEIIERLLRRLHVLIYMTRSGRSAAEIRTQMIAISRQEDPLDSEEDTGKEKQCSEVRHC